MWTQADLCDCVENGRVLWRKHALERMFARGISRAEVVRALCSGEFIEEYADDRPYPSVLLGTVDAPFPLHVVVALDRDKGEAHVITAYHPDLAHFAPDYKTRIKT